MTYRRTTWILLRGLTREVSHWGDFPVRLHQVLGEASVVLPIDLPGNGSLSHMPSPRTVPQMLDACRAQVAAAGLRPPFHVLAMSLGGMVAVEWMHRSPDELAACVLLNTSLRPYSPFYHRLRPRSYLELLHLALVWGQAATAETLIHRLTSRSDDFLVSNVSRWAAIRTARPVSRANALRQLVAAARYHPASKTPAVPVLLLSGQRDGLVNSRCSAAIASAWSCAAEKHPAAGHDLPLDAPEWVVTRISQWLSALDSTALVCGNEFTRLP
ncbi:MULTISPECIES: alpha/beta hydrolase [unclassified Acidovorax]|uniref:alpha/beta fold hydrolase n=1 Tax=unclassified Acidovorax TaxID=2684926 RepID=UPI002882E163|nr:MULTISPECIES: alpha/beta hydrolase [unclassified Acidovorax]